MSTIIILIVLLIVVYLFLSKKFKYWKEKNVKTLKPLPLIGNMWPVVSRQTSFADMMVDLCNKFSGERYFGVYQFLIPTLVVKDPNLIKRITVKDFDVFPEHRQIIADDVDPLWTKNLFSSPEHTWRELRPTLSPAFTSSKMKYMFGLIKDCAEEFINYFIDKNENIITIDSKDTFRRYATDIIATTAFGVKCNSLKNPNNEMYIMGQEGSNFDGIRVLKLLLGPKIGKLFKITLIPPAVSKFFTNLIAETLSIRSSKGIIRPDMIHLLMEARKGRIQHDETTSIDTGFATAQESDSTKATFEKKKIELTTEDITAQALIFFLAGYDTVSTLMCFMAHELAINPEVQERLREEVDQVYDDCDGNVTYEKLMEMKYLDMVISETLRMWPPSPIIDRINVKPYSIPAENSNEETVHLPLRSVIWLPVFAIHRNPKYFPNPHKFDPERFNDVNKHKIQPFTYMPFGLGPRNCIGSRFALLETKILFFYLLRNFQIEVVEKTPIPIKLTATFNLVPVGGLWVGFKRRQITNL